MNKQRFANTHIPAAPACQACRQVEVHLHPTVLGSSD
jgi:hypothetical protein